MNWSRKTTLILGLFIAMATAGLLSWFLARQGLVRAGLWATVLIFGLTAVGTAIACWTLVITILSSRSVSRPRASSAETAGAKGSDLSRKIIVGPVRTTSTSGITALTEVGEPRLIRTNGSDSEIIFDLTSKAEIDIGVAAIYLRVVSYLPLHVLQEHPYAGIAETRKYTCRVGEEAKLYECVQRSPGYDYIRLSPGELERVQVAVSADLTGLYEVVVSIQCAIDGKLQVLESEKVKVGLMGRDFNPTHDEYTWRRLLAPDVESRVTKILADSEKAEDRHVAAVVLAEFAVPEAIDGLREALRDDRFHDKMKAIDLLADYRDPRAIDVLEDFVNENEGYLHQHAADALRRTRPPDWRFQV